MSTSCASALISSPSLPSVCGRNTCRKLSPQKTPKLEERWLRGEKGWMTRAETVRWRGRKPCPEDDTFIRQERLRHVCKRKCLILMEILKGNSSIFKPGLYCLHVLECELIKFSKSFWIAPVDHLQPAKLQFFDLFCTRNSFAFKAVTLKIKSCVRFHW